VSTPWYPPPDRMSEAEKLEVSRRILAYNRMRAERTASERRPKTKPKASKPPVYDYLSDDWRL
jgi:hypothetical protein